MQEFFIQGAKIPLNDSFKPSLSYRAILNDGSYLKTGIFESISVKFRAVINDHQFTHSPDIPEVLNFRVYSFHISFRGDRMSETVHNAKKAWAVKANIE